MRVHFSYVWAKFAFVLFAVSSSTVSRAQTIYTPYAFTNFVGSPLAPGWADGSGTNAQLHIPHSIAVDAAGNLFVADTFNHSIRKVTPDGTMTTIAGSPSNKGYSDGVGFAEAASFNSPIGVGSDTNGNLYVADNGNQTIRKVTPDGTVTLFAGRTGVKGNANGDRLSAAMFNSPYTTVVAPNGNMFVSDGVNRVIRKIDPDGIVSLFAGSFNLQGTNDGVGSVARFQQPAGLAVDAANNVYVADQGGHTIRKITPEGTVTTVAGKGKAAGSTNGQGADARFQGPEGIAVDGAGNLFVCDSGNHLIRKITPDGTVSTIAGTAGTRGVTDGTNQVALFSTPRGITVNIDGAVYVADSANSSIRKIVQNGSDWVVTTFAGTTGANGSVDAVGLDARFHFPYALTHDGAGNLYTMDRSNDSVRKITPDGTVTTLAGIPQFVGSADGKGATAQFYEPEELAVDPAGNIYVVEHANNTVRKIAPVGTSGTNYVVTTLAGCPTCAAGTNDGPGLQARFDGPFGLTRDKAGNIFVADSGNKTIRKLTQTDSGWTVSTFAGKPKVGGLKDGTGADALLSAPVSLGIDSGDNIFVCDGQQVRKITPDAAVSFVAGGLTLGTTDGPGASALFSLVRGIAVDSHGTIFVGDSSNGRVRKITPSGGGYNVTTMGGGGLAGASDGVGVDAQFNQPSGIAVDSHGNLYVVDSSNERITKGIDPSQQQNSEVVFDTTSGSITQAGDSFTFKVSTTATGSLVIEASSDLLNWAPVQTNALSGAAIDLTVPFQTTLNSFFRLRLTQ